MHIYNQGFTRELYRIDTILWFLDSLVQISWSFVDQLQQAPRQHHGCQHQVWKAHLTRSWLARCVGFRNLWKTWDRRDNSISICGLCSATLSYVVTFWHFTLQKTTGKGNRAHQVGWSIPILQMWFSSPQTPRNYSLVTHCRFSTIWFLYGLVARSGCIKLLIFPGQDVLQPWKPQQTFHNLSIYLSICLSIYLCS